VKRLALLALLLVLALLAYRGSRAACTCAEARAAQGWCEACAVGYVGPLELRSRGLFDALDLHGHDIEAAALECAGCRAALAADGYCAADGRGFLAGRAYLSPLAYHLARGETAAVERELDVVRRAVLEAQRCELCAEAMVSNGTCPRCLLRYQDGVASPVARGGS